jgi:hypothetical protein
MTKRSETMFCLVTHGCGSKAVIHGRPLSIQSVAQPFGILLRLDCA